MFRGCIAARFWLWQPKRIKFWQFQTELKILGVKFEFFYTPPVLLRAGTFDKGTVMAGAGFYAPLPLASGAAHLGAEGIEAHTAIALRFSASCMSGSLPFCPPAPAPGPPC
jgi:hypothetical protein